MTEEQLCTLRHMLGINTPYDRVPRPYRNYAAVNKDDPKYLELERLGLVERYRSASSLWGDYDCYRCTEAGRQAATASHRTIRKPRAARVYHKFLEVSDACPDLSFREFLTSDDFAESRRSA